jgi:serine/threonine protein kinase/WD40 repeat protein
MELVEGLSLDRWAAAHRDERAAQLGVMAAVCAAVQSAHERRIVHRDLKPGNILVKADGQPVVVDFGIARLAGIVVGEEAGMFSGTPVYAAPEQHLGRDADFRSGESVDVYALGAILFEVLTGRRLFNIPRSAGISEIRRAILEDPIPRLGSLLANCPAELEEVVARAVRRDPADRFYSVAALGRAITRVMDTEGSVPAAPSWAPAITALIPGTQWRLVDKIGEGGTGQVWVGRHDQLGETCVFKFCDTEEKARTLKRELTLFRLLKQHIGANPHFIQLKEVSLDEPPWYLMMEQVDAHDLEAWAKAQPGGLSAVSEHVRLEIVAQAAEALQAAHEAGILHRDIKPSNLLVKGTAAGPVHVFVADFGIGQLASDELVRQGTRLGFTRTVSNLLTDPMSGTMLYLAPEVMEGKTATARADIYSLGVVLWQLLIGDVHAAVDPADWATRVSDPLLREDLARCLAGSPEKRWSSAGELAARLRGLPERRTAEARRLAELAARQRAAQRRKVLRLAVLATVVVLVLIGLSFLAWRQSHQASQASAEDAVNQAAALRTDFTAGRRARGMDLLETAAPEVSDRAKVRSAAAAVFGLPDLVQVAPEKAKARPVAPVVPTIGTNETCRVASHNATWTAVARDLDGLNGSVELIRGANGARLSLIERTNFPWIPVPEPALLSFSPDNKLLAIGGAATSRHILLCNLPDGSLQSYLFHGSDPSCCAWHGGGRLIAIGCADGAILIWDSQAAVSPSRSALSTNQFDLPPVLDVPAQDHPAQRLPGHSSALRHLVFSSSGEWLASLDAAGYLRIHTGFGRFRTLGLTATGPSRGPSQDLGVVAPLFAVEVRLASANQVTALEAEEDRVIVRRGALPAEEFQFVPSDFPAELPVAQRIGEFALNPEGTELCAITATDIHWLRTDPLDFLQTARGENPVGVRGQQREGCWLIAKDHQLADWHPATDSVSPKVSGSPLRLSEALAGQGSRTAIATAGDDRVAAYCGRRIQFFNGMRPGVPDSPIIAKGGTGSFREIFWDHPGRLLGVVFELSNGGLRLESWETSTNFPPTNRTFDPVELDCQWIVPANDGRHCIGRGRARGLFRFDPADSSRLELLDTNSVSRNNAPLACTPDGSLLAMVADRSTIRLFALPGGKPFSDLYCRRQSDLIGLAWDSSNRHLAAASNDGFVQVWNLGPWQRWLRTHRLEK